MIFSEDESIKINDNIFTMIKPESHQVIMKYLEKLKYNIWEFSFCGMINDLEFGDIFYKEENDALVIYNKDKVTGKIDLYAPPFCDIENLTTRTIKELDFLKQINPDPVILRISENEKKLFTSNNFIIMDKNIPLFTILPKNIFDLSYPNFRRLRRSLTNYEKNYGKPILKKYKKENYDNIVKLRTKWHHNAVNRGITPDSDCAFKWLLNNQEEYNIDSYEVYVNDEIKGFISFAPHHNKTCINLYRIADNEFRGLSSYGYLESIKIISEKYDVILDGSGSRKSLYDFKKQFTDIVYNEYSVGLK